MIIKQYTLGPIENNNYLVVDETTKDAALIDATGMSDELVKDVENLNCDVKYILLTHGHFDHITGVQELKKYFGAKVFMNELDMDWDKNINLVSPQFDISPVEIPVIDEFINDGDKIKIGGLIFKVISTPGHTKGGVCYLIENVLFSGDTLFRDCVGRCDLPGGNYKDIQKSIKEKLFTLPEDTIVYPGHGAPTSIGYEKEFNKEI
ncbi:MBL fold metallo-hydrolase [bacterium]|nr:MBL fold metallo-hydrolase [bacterium]